MSLLWTRARLALGAPRYLAPRIAGVDLSTSAIKMARVALGTHGLELEACAELRLPAGAAEGGEILDRAAVVEALHTLAREHGVTHAAVSLPESKSYLFEAVGEGATRAEWLAAVEPRLEQFVPLAPSDTLFDIAPARAEGTQVRLVGAGYARRVVERTLALFDEAGIVVHGMEGEDFALARALFAPGDPLTTLVIDIGRSTTKMMIVADRLPRYSATFGIGGHAFTLAVQKHFGVTEEEARRIKAERGVVPVAGNEDYTAAMLSTAAAIRDELAERLSYWQSHAAGTEGREPVSRAVMVGGNASVRGLPEYLEGALRVPVVQGDVFCNFASRDYWLPGVEYLASLAYGTAIGLALRSYAA